MYIDDKSYNYSVKFRKFSEDWCVFVHAIVIRMTRYKNMTEQALQQYLIKQYPKEDEGCEWKEFKNLKNDFSGHENNPGLFAF